MNLLWKMLLNLITLESTLDLWAINSAEFLIFWDRSLFVLCPSNSDGTAPDLNYAPTSKEALLFWAIMEGIIY